jgi:hypothetical protein
LEWTVSAGTAVSTGDPIGKLTNAELDLDVTRLRGERDVRAAELESLKRRSAQQANRGLHEALAQIPAAEKALADIQQRWQERLDEQQRLMLTAPVSGVAVSPPRRPTDSAPGQLAAWSGDPLDPVNRGAFLPVGTLFCSIGDRDAMEALLVINQSDIQLVQVGQFVRIQLDQLPGHYLEGRISEIARIDIESAPPEFAASGMLPLQTEPDGQRQLVGVFYQARVRLDDHPTELLPGGIGRARIHVAPRSFGRRIIWYLSDTFRFRL